MSDITPIQTKRLVGYFPAEAHKQNYDVADIPAGQLSHVIYAFAGIAADGSCVSVDTKDDKINFPQLRHLKHHHPNLQILISVGGASNEAFPGVAESDEKRLKFVQTSVQFMMQNGFDGIDIDWEFPTAADSANFTELLQELRSQLAAQGDADGCHYLLTMAAPAGPTHIANLQLAQIHSLLDWFNLEAYDFTTASSRKTNFVAPLFTTEGALNVSAAVTSYLGAGVPADKIVMGVRFVGTGWQGVGPANNGLDQTDTGPAPGTWDQPGRAKRQFRLPGYRGQLPSQLHAQLGRRGASALALQRRHRDHDQLRGPGVADCESELCAVQPTRRHHDLGACRR